jgi:large subunit ribosomal protein L10
MAVTKAKKQKIIDDLVDKFTKQKSVVFFDFTGLKVKDLTNFRKKVKSVAGNVKVAKKTLLKIALSKSGIGEIDVKSFKGEIAVAFDFKDQVSVPKVCYDFSKENPLFKIVGGLFEKRLISSQEVIELAQLPSREELLRRFIGSIYSPLYGFVNVLEENIKGLLRVLSAIKK